MKVYLMPEVSLSWRSKMTSEENFARFQPRMPANDPNKLNTKRTILLSLSFTTVLLAWSYFNFAVPRLLDIVLPAEPYKESLKGFIMAMDNFVAVLMQPLFGKLSDKTKSKLGRRMPYILIGTSASAFFLLVMPFVQIALGLVLVILCFDLSMSIYRIHAIAILPDYSPRDFHSKASSIQQFIANLGGVIAFVIPTIVGVLAATATEWDRLGIGFFIVAILMGLLLTLNLMKIKETPTGEKFLGVGQKCIEIDPITLKVCEKSVESTEEKVSVYVEIGLLFKAKEKSFLYMCLVVFCAYFGFAAIEAFFSTFASVYLGKATGPTGTIFLAYSVPMILTAPIWGIVGQKFGRRRAAMGGLLGVVITSAIMAFVLVPASYHPMTILETGLSGANYLLMLNLACISMPWMCFIVNSFPIVWNLAPEGRVGAYTGIYYFFNQLAYTLAPILMGGILDAFGPLGAYKYITMFPAIFIVIIIAFLLIFKVKRGDVAANK